MLNHLLAVAVAVIGWAVIGGIEIWTGAPRTPFLFALAYAAMGATICAVLSLKT